MVSDDGALKHGATWPCLSTSQAIAVRPILALQWAHTGHGVVPVPVVLVCVDWPFSWDTCPASEATRPCNWET